MSKDQMERVDLARRWAGKHLPAESRMSLDIDVQDVKSQIDDEMIGFIEALASWMDEKKTGDDIQNFIYEEAKRRDMKLGAAFQSIYLTTLGKKRGPKAGPFLASLDRGWLVQRLKEAL